MTMGKLTKLPRAEQWADRICTQLGKTVESIIDVGRLLVKAKGDLEHGEWGRLFDDKLVPFGQRTAHRLMTIAEHPVISNRTHASDLPATWTTLYELTKVEPTRWPTIENPSLTWDRFLLGATGCLTEKRSTAGARS